MITPNSFTVEHPQERKNTVTCLTADDGTTHTDSAGIGRIVSGYFHNIFTSAVNDDNINWESAMGDLPNRISSDFFD